MGWVVQNRGWLVACAVSALVGVFFTLWLKSSRSQIVTSNPAVDKPAPVQPVFIHDTTIILKRLGGSSGATQTAQVEPQSPPPETVYQSSSPTKPCEPFSLHLKSSPTSLSSVLDSVTLDYFYPSGMNNWAYFGAKSKIGQSSSFYPTIPDAGLLSWGIQSTYRTFQSRLDAQVFLRSNLQRRVYIVGGYEITGNSHPSWFLTAGKQWKLF